MDKHFTGDQRSDLIELVSTGRATVAEAAARQGVATSTVYRWLREAAAGSKWRGAKQRAPSVNRRPRGPTFVQLVPAAHLTATIEVRVGGTEVQVRSGFDPELLRGVVEALRGGTP